MNSATSSPNAHPWTLGKGRPIGPVEVPPIGSRPVQGWIWYDMVFHGCQRVIEIMLQISKMTVVHLSSHIIWSSISSLLQATGSLMTGQRHEFMICSKKYTHAARKEYARRFIAS